MIIPIVIGFLGLALGGRSKPISKHKKMLMLGPVSGEHYNVEDMPDSAIVIVHAKDGTSVTFDRDPETAVLKFKVARAKSKATVEAVRKDFEPAQLEAPAQKFPRAV